MTRRRRGVGRCGSRERSNAVLLFSCLLVSSRLSSCLLFSCLLVSSRVLSGQGVTAGVGGLLGNPDRTQYTAGWLLPRLGFLEPSLGGTLLTGRDGRRTGAQLELDLFRQSSARWYGVASMSGGWGEGGAESPWGAWSVGLGYRLVSVGQSDLGLEGRYVRLGRPDDVLSLGIRLAIRFQGGSRPRPEPVLPRPAGTPVPSSEPPPLSTVSAAAPPEQLVVQTAIDAMGTPYAWGGSGDNGFDCSGLIQYAYARHGISLPRRSIDQARAGLLVPREINQLLPGDILTFSASPGGPVSHVGLYVGDRRFIHSASDGVRLSRLSADDPFGKHWWDRWLGARRMIPSSPDR